MPTSIAQCRPLASIVVDNQKGLNKRQLEAVNHPDGPILIAAGAGSGKTKTLTSRLAQLIAAGAPPANIIAITFTNKAANEMKSRLIDPNNPNAPELSKHLGHSGGRSDSLNRVPFVGTFHSLGARILKKEAKLLGRTSAFTIFDEDDSLSLLKKVMKAQNIDREQYNPLKVSYKIGTVKNELFDPIEYLDDIQLRIFDNYEAALAQNNAFDFDDLIEKVVRLFEKEPAVLAKYQNQFRYVLVDEYQDVNTSQYRLIKLLADKHQNLSVVGDDAQCVPPETKIITEAGPKMIEAISLKDKVMAAAGNGQTHFVAITEIKRFKYSGPLIKITTTDGKFIRVTPNHLVFAKPQLLEGIFYVYLMYRADKGFRIGLVKGSRWGPRGKRQIGLIVRNNQEKADKMWILKVCHSRAEAEYYEYYYAFSYGIPTLVFDTNSRHMQITQDHVNKVFASIDTKNRARHLMTKELIYFSYPHWLPKGTIRHSAKRLRIRLTLFDDRRKSLVNPWGMSRISINTKDLKLKRSIENLGFSTRKGKLSDWRLEIARLDYGKIEKIASLLKKVGPEVEVVRSACLTNGKRLFFQPASHVRPTMRIAAMNNGRIIEKTVRKVETEQYNGLVYDLNVKNVHNYIAADFVVHNSIYGFRGSDFRNFLNFENDWPGAKVVKLEQNYRSTGNIITAASALIKNNKLQKPKDLWTENPAGELIKVTRTGSAEEEAEWVVNQINQSTPTPEGRGSDRSVGAAILYRTNAQSRSVEQSLIAADIPYRIFGGLKFYERKEIKDVVAALRLAANPRDSVSAERLTKTFRKDIGADLVEELPKLGKKLNILELINFFIQQSDYFGYLAKIYPNAPERIENINELIVFAGEFNNLSEFLERVSLLQSADTPAGKLPITNYQLPVHLMTIHLAKGLEFDNVFVIGCSEGLLPHQMSYRSLEEIEEERRLMYVAMTRARKNLSLSFYHTASRFLYELPPELIEFSDLAGRSGTLPNDDDRYIEDFF